MNRIKKDTPRNSPHADQTYRPQPLTEEQGDDQQGRTRRDLRRRRSLVQGVGLIAALSLVAAVALALKLALKTPLLSADELADDGRRLAGRREDTVAGGAQVQVRVAVRVPAQAAAARGAQSLAAQLGCRGDVEEVLTQRAPQIRVQVRAAVLERTKERHHSLESTFTASKTKAAGIHRGCDF